MSTLSVQPPVANNALPSAGAKAKKPKRAEPKPLHVKRKPGMQTSAAIRACAWALLEEGFDYEEAQELFRLALIEKALRCSKGVKTTAGARLGISREHVRKYLARGKDVL
jgi:hypothetical protein